MSLIILHAFIIKSLKNYGLTVLNKFRQTSLLHQSYDIQSLLCIFSSSEQLSLWSDLCPPCCLQMDCRWRIWIHLPQQCYERQAAHCCWAECCPEPEDANEALSRLPAAEMPPAERPACDSWQGALWKLWHTSLPAVAEKKKKESCYNLKYPVTDFNKV